MITSSDMEELKRIATNTYDNDKTMMFRIIKGINDMDRKITQLKTENVSLKKIVEDLDSQTE